jgi:D-3-phosphoglycerate dehydrogenase
MERRMKVYLTEPISREAMERLGEKVDLVVEAAAVPKKELLRRVSDIDILFNKTDTSPVDRDVMEAASRMGYIVRHGTGYSNVDVACATEKGIPVSFTPGVQARSIAEYTLGLILVMARKMIAAADAAQKGDPDRRDFLGHELFGRTLGVIGVGNIGREVVRLAAGFGMKILAHHPRPSAVHLSDLPLRLVDLTTLLDESDVVSIHAPLNDETRALIGAGQLSRMKGDAVLVNMGRGGIVDEQALIRAVKTRTIAGAALDVVEREPVQKDDPLLGVENLIVMPHIASMTVEAQRRAALMAVEDILRFIRGERPLHLVNPDVYADEGQISPAGENLAT